MKEENRIGAYEVNMRSHYDKGKLIVWLIAICNVIFSLLSNILGSFDVRSILIQVGLSTTLVIGVNWIRWLFVINAILDLVVGIYIYASIAEVIRQNSKGAIIVLIIINVQSIITGIVLTFSKSVSEFFYERRIQ
ncbi:MAG: hypothetical protein E7231_16140 [Cellulosilyticum sp.]|nr:hypothetical protein [Cellulosilyticum sp.]